jgi:hypothetical protein
LRQLGGRDFDGGRQFNGAWTLYYNDQRADVLPGDKTAATMSRIVGIEQFRRFDPYDIGDNVDLVPILMPFQEG